MATGQITIHQSHLPHHFFVSAADYLDVAVAFGLTAGLTARG